MVARLGSRSTGRLAPQRTVPQGPGGVLVRRGMMVESTLTCRPDQPGRVGPACGGGQDARPDAFTLPAPEQGP
ncbi:hypothetical protein Arub01_27550 [Actinomadura rubrobrunea]|uniref:Uncharacterized protein n=1 Tax=Actinomadura rubrobrunea TaxID=115335 RepID=A0A9W6PWL0_9ACTN|nr:hypothetical protein Arub01_27550 [Actinomadura rubrobrunea]